MPNSIDPAAQQARRREALWSALSASIWLLLTGLILLTLRHYFQIEGFWGALLLIFAVLDLGMIIPIWILLRARLKEIEGGEEDAAAQY